MKIKRILGALFIILLTFVLVACGEKADDKATPTVEVIDVLETQESFTFDFDILDVDSVGEVTAIELFKGNELVQSLSELSSRKFTELLSNNEYELRVTYTYDLNDGNGAQTVVATHSVTTLTKATPTVEVIDVLETQESFTFDLNILDVDKVGEVTSIELFKDNELVKELEDLDLRLFTELLSNNLYEIRITYEYDLNDGAGEYSLYFSKLGYRVDAIELATNNINKFKNKITPDLNINLSQGTALDLSKYKDNNFDIVLLMGPLYHLENEADRLKALNEALRVCKQGGIIVSTFISNDMVILTEFDYDPNFFKGDSYNHETFKVNNFPFVFDTVDDATNLINKLDMDIINIVAQDGASELMADKINQLSDDDYDQYLRYHYYICEKPEFLGMSNHLMFICKKR